MRSPIASRPMVPRTNKNESSSASNAAVIQVTWSDISSDENSNGEFSMSHDLFLRELATRREPSNRRDHDGTFDDPTPCVQLFEEFATEHYW